jgi:hypothetical protein
MDKNRKIRVMRNALDTILFEAKEPIIKVYAQSALDETKDVPGDDGFEIVPKNSYCKTHNWYGAPDEKCPLCNLKILNAIDKEMLLKPRWKVIAEWPGMEIFSVGDITDLHVVHVGSLGYRPDGFPHLFKKLEWWEERKPKEMPEYIVKACNLFPELVEVLEIFTNDIIKDRYGELLSHGYSEEEVLKMICNGEPLLKKAKELLSKVKQ